MNPPPATLDAPPDPLQSAIEQVVESEGQQRLWLRALLPYLAVKPPKGCDPRVQLACDRLLIAVAERVKRIVWSDLGPDQRPPAEPDQS